MEEVVRVEEAEAEVEVAEIREGKAREAREAVVQTREMEEETGLKMTGESQTEKV